MYHFRNGAVKNQHLKAAFNKQLWEWGGGGDVPTALARSGVRPKCFDQLYTKPLLTDEGHWARWGIYTLNI